MEFFLKWLAMASVQLAATMSPGPAFVMSMRNSVVYGRYVGVLTALGLALGVGAHVIFVLAGLSFVIAQSVYFYNFIKYAGAAYLIYIGIKSLRARKRVDAAQTDEPKGAQVISITPFEAVKIGFLTNLLNPKAVLFFTAVYSQFVDIHTPWHSHALYGLTSVAIEFLWFAGVAVVLTNPMIKQRFVRIVHWIERACGGLMIALGLKLALSK
jgi:RhtB (resistance to homoserine/threonine) family protein